MQLMGRSAILITVVDGVGGATIAERDDYFSKTPTVGSAHNTIEPQDIECRTAECRRKARLDAHATRELTLWRTLPRTLCE